MRWWWFFFLPSVAAFSVRDCVSPDWACEYMRQHNKTYASKEEFTRRLSILGQTRQRLQHHGRRLMDLSLKLGPYADRHVHERPVNHFEKHKQRRRRSLRQKLRAAPMAFDWRRMGFETPVPVQGDCGGCFAFAAAGVLEYWDQKWRAGTPHAISAQAAMDCTSTHNGGQNEGCDGGLMEDVFEYAETHALPYASEDPYRGKDSECRAGSVSNYVSSYATMSSDDDPLAEEHLAWLVTHYGPVAVSIDSKSDAFQNYAGGIFPGTMCGKEVDHAALVVGFGPGYWILKNSWGKAWGEHGYMRLKRGVNACGITDYIAYVRSVHA